MADIKDIKQKLTHHPNWAEGYFQLGQLYGSERKWKQAIAHFLVAVELNPEQPIYWNELGFTWKKGWYLKQALDCYERALQLNPNDAGLHNNIATVLRHWESPQQVLEHYSRALELAPQTAYIRSNRLFYLATLPDLSETQLFQEFSQWQNNHALLPLPGTYSNIPDSKRRLRIGYISADFCKHPMAIIVNMLFQHHNPVFVETFIYSDTKHPDAMTDRLKKSCHHWQHISEMSDEAVFEQIRSDQIDILVDLSGHTAYNRLTLFTRKPAPLQVTGFGFPFGTGLSTMDYHFTDPIMTPPGTPASEHPLYLTCALHWQPLELSHPVSPAPFIGNGYLTFGSANNLYKLNDRVLALWGQILHQIPHSRLHLKAKALREKEVQIAFQNRCKKQGIPLEQLLLSAGSEYENYFNYYHQIDIALDPFPYNGGVTTCETLWMGVPLITLAGGRRMGASILTALGSPQWIAEDEQQYVQIASELADAKQHLSQYRQTLRSQLLASPICDANGFVREVEAAYQKIWTRWCNHEISKH